jgi:hypothetical protein
MMNHKQELNLDKLRVLWKPTSMAEHSEGFVVSFLVDKPPSDFC